MESKYDDHAVDIPSDHDSAAAPSQANTGTAASHQTSTSKSMWKKASESCLDIASAFLVLLVIIFVTLIMGSLALVFTCTVIPGIIICLVLAYMITSLHQFSRCDDHADLDDEYDTDLGSYRYELVVWMIQLTGILVVELLMSLALFRIGPFTLKRLSLLDVHVWKWFLIGIVVLVYFGFWLLTHIVIHKAREKWWIRGDFFREDGDIESSIRGVFFWVYVLPVLKGLLGVAVCGFYFLVEFLIIKLVPPLRRPKILGLNAHKWMHALVYVFIGLNVSRIISASVVAMVQKKHEPDVKFVYNTNKFETTPRVTKRTTPHVTKRGCRELSVVLGFMGRGYKFIMSLLFRRSTSDPKKHEHDGKFDYNTEYFMRTGCRFIMSLLFKSFDSKKCMIYIVIGLRRSINFVLISIWLLVTWISHFAHQLKPSHDTTWILRVGTGTLICLLICAILWLVKNSIILWWKYRSMYSRFYDEVLEEGIKLYFLGMICGRHLDVLKVGWSRPEKKKKAEDRRKGRIVAKARRTLLVPHELVKADHRQNGDHQLMNSTPDDKTSHQPGIYVIRRMVRYFLGAEDMFKEDINASIEKLRMKWRQAHPPNDQNARSTPLTLGHIEAAYETKLSDVDFKNLLSQIKRDENSEKQDINLQDFERWMERSHKTCFNRVSTLASAQQLAQYLNRVMIAVIIFTTIAIWLTLVTKGTKAVTLLVGPLIALSFIFGDTCSTVFKGIMFSYVIQPYGIGDICIINGTLYEVKRIDFWTTTFLKVETNEVVSCPNSALFSDPIINKTKKKGRLDDNDSIEFILESDANKQNILALIKRIDDHFMKEQSTNFQKPRVEMKCGIPDTGKQNVTIHFKHHLKDFQGVSNSESLQEMNKRKEKLQHDVKDQFTDLKIRPAKEDNH